MSNYQPQEGFNQPQGTPSNVYTPQQGQQQQQMEPPAPQQPTAQQNPQLATATQPPVPEQQQTQYSAQPPVQTQQQTQSPVQAQPPAQTQQMPPQSTQSPNYTQTSTTTASGGVEQSARPDHQLIRKDGNGVFLEILLNSAGIDKLGFGFASYDKNAPAGKRQTGYILFYLDMFHAALIANDILSGRYAGFAAKNKAANPSQQYQPSVLG